MQNLLQKSEITFFEINIKIMSAQSLRKTKAAIRRFSAKNLFWKGSKKSQENICDWELFSTSSLVFFCNFSEKFQNGFSTAHLRTTASANHL